MPAEHKRLHDASLQAHIDWWCADDPEDRAEKWAKAEEAFAAHVESWAPRLGARCPAAGDDMDELVADGGASRGADAPSEDTSVSPSA